MKGNKVTNEAKQHDQVAPIKDLTREVSEAGKSQQSEPVDKVKLIVEDWFLKNVYNSPLSRDTEAFNYLRTRLELLTETLRGLIK
jgi:hypothetical protein